MQRFVCATEICMCIRKFFFVTIQQKGPFFQEKWKRLCEWIYNTNNILGDAEWSGVEWIDESAWTTHKHSKCFTTTQHNNTGICWGAFTLKKTLFQQNTKHLRENKNKKQPPNNNIPRQVSTFCLHDTFSCRLSKQMTNRKKNDDDNKKKKLGKQWLV